MWDTFVSTLHLSGITYSFKDLRSIHKRKHKFTKAYKLHHKQLRQEKNKLKFNYYYNWQLTRGSFLNKKHRASCQAERLNRK